LSKRIAVPAAIVALAAGTQGVVWAATSDDDAPSFSPSACWHWVDGASLGTTETGEQWASATVSGLTDADHNAGFRLRGGDTSLLVAVSGTGWKIEGTGWDTSGAGSLPASGPLRVAISAENTVTISYAGSAVTTQRVPGTYPGRGLTPSIWQSSVGVAMADIRSNATGAGGPSQPGSASPAQPSQPGSPTSSATQPDPPPPTGSAPTGIPPGGTTWLSGAASRYAADGSFGGWRGEPVTIAGTWDDSFEAQTALYSITVGDLKDWNGPLDEAIGAIWKSRGESWAQAAAGAYDARWTTALTNLKNAWGSRNPANLYLRFAHEMNGGWTDWNVQPGEEASFRTALTRFSTLRYQLLPQAHLVLCPNDGTGTGIDVRNLFVAQDGQGRRVVDVYSTDTYNQYPHRTDYQDIMASFSTKDSSGAPVGVEAHRAFAQSSGVPFAVSEWSNCGIASDCDGGGGESPAYVRAFNDWARAHAGDVRNPVAGQLLYEVQFNLWPRFLFYPDSQQPGTAAAYVAATWGQ
jgi:hypothetical protein